MSRHRDLERQGWPVDLRLPQLERDVDIVEENVSDLRESTTKAIKNQNKMLMLFLGSSFAALIALVANLIQNAAG